MKMNLLSGRVKEFTAVYSDFYPVVYRGIYSRIRDEDIAGDLAQEVFMRYFQRMEEVENPRSWLFSTMKFVLLEHYRKNSVDTVDIDDVFYDTSIQYVNGFRDTRIILQGALEAPENYRDEKERVIYELIAIQNYTYEEAAKLLGLTKRQVHYRYISVVERIMDYLRKKGIKNLEELL